MSSLGQRIRAAVPATVLLTLVAGLGQLVAAATGLAPAPRGWQVAVSLAMAALLGAAATPLVQSAYAAVVGGPDPTAGTRPDPTAGQAAAGQATAGQTTAAEPAVVPAQRGTRERATARRAGTMTLTAPPPTAPRSRRKPPTGPSPARIAVVAGAVVVLGLVCWLRLGEPGRILSGLAQAGFGQLSYLLPVLPLLALLPRPAGQRPPVPWTVLTRREWANLPRFAVAVLRATRAVLLGHPLGVAVATTALLHLARSSPGFEAGGYRLAGGLLGIAVATPLRLLLSGAAATGLLLAVLCCAALVATGHLYRTIGRYPAVAVLAVLVLAPLVAAGVLHATGYHSYLEVRGSRVVLVAGLSPGHWHDVTDAGVALADVPPAMHPVLRGGLRVTDAADGRRIAAGLADPTRAAAPEGLPDGGLILKAGDCFSFIGGTSNFRYTAPCNGEHTGEVFYVGHLPFTVNPGTPVRDAAARGICEKTYGTYLGVPYGGSYLTMEAPIIQRGAWRPRPVVACVFGAVGPWSLKATRTISAQQQAIGWAPGATGCRVETAGGLRISGDQPGARCVAPDKAAQLATSPPMQIDAEFAPLGKAAGNARVGVACVAADTTTGYYLTVGGDGVLELTKQIGTERVRLGAGGKAKTATSPSPQTATTQVQVICRPDPTGGVRIAANAGKNRVVTFVDKDRPVLAYTPRLVVEAVDAPVSAAVNLFSTVLVQ